MTYTARMSRIVFVTFRIDEVGNGIIKNLPLNLVEWCLWSYCIGTVIEIGNGKTEYVPQD
jgi:hypothetical protein